MKLNQWLMAAGIAVVLCLGVGGAFAQDNAGQGGGRRQRGGGGPGGGNFDPAQMQQRMMERVKEQLEVTDDSEWKALEPRVQKVLEARMSGLGGMGRGMFGRGNRGGGGDNAQGDQAQPRPRFGPAPMPEAEALQKAIEAKASKAELTAAMAKYQEARKTKQAELERAQAELRKLLTTRQEAIALANGWL